MPYFNSICRVEEIEKAIHLPDKSVDICPTKMYNIITVKEILNK